MKFMNPRVLVMEGIPLGCVVVRCQAFHDFGRFYDEYQGILWHYDDDPPKNTLEWLAPYYGWLSLVSYAEVFSLERDIQPETVTAHRINVVSRLSNLLGIPKTQAAMDFADVIPPC